MLSPTLLPGNHSAVPCFPKCIIKSDLKIELNEFSEMNFDFRRNLETDSTEFYSLAYNYLNDCLRAGVVFRRKFYEDRDIEHSDSLMFKISLIPLGDAFALSLIHI